ncbi:hypothetical protein BZZ01_08445 [Nostocales cyanobacterium HT-58-2]|nr:hypothetical protein BZZ01_08445 [Nostocales cyanobacterium HT-58-2]
MRTITGSVHSSTPAPNTQTYSPAVPISVYRDLAAELQAVQAKLDGLNVQNQQLVQENQVLRQEIAKAVESVLRLQKLVDAQAKVSSHQTSQAPADYRTEIKRPLTETTSHQAPADYRTEIKRPLTEATSKEQVSRPRVFYRESSPTPPFPSVMQIPVPVSEPVFIEEQDVSYTPHSESRPTQIRGWWLIIAILLIIVLGFGTGYLVVRPLFESHSR